MKDSASVSQTTEPTMTEAKLRFMCEQLREWGGLPEDEVRRIYEAEAKRLVSNAE